MKKDIKDTTFIIPIRIESEDRLRNVITVCCFLLETFDTKIRNNDFLEFQDVYGNLYGSTLESVLSITSTGADVILEIDYQGMLAVKSVIPDAVSIYIIPPSIDALKERLEYRGEDETEVINKHCRQLIL